jgi:hypothetical protein
LLDGKAVPDAGSFAAAVCQACEARMEFLVEQGFAQRQGQPVVVATNLLDTLRTRELGEAAARIARKNGINVSFGARERSRFRRLPTLTNTRQRSLCDARRWRRIYTRAVETRRSKSVLVKTISAMVQGPSVSWAFGRQQGASIGTP